MATKWAKVLPSMPKDASERVAVPTSNSKSFSFVMIGGLFSVL
jgi:hypothetical protein